MFVGMDQTMHKRGTRELISALGHFRRKQIFHTRAVTIKLFTAVIYGFS
jgi:hypothetical protein